jgi:hypothetical protein
MLPNRFAPRSTMYGVHLAACGVLVMLAGVASRPAAQPAVRI